MESMGDAGGRGEVDEAARLGKGRGTRGSWTLTHD